MEEKRNPSDRRTEGRTGRKGRDGERKGEMLRF